MNEAVSSPQATGVDKMNAFFKVLLARGTEAKQNIQAVVRNLKKRHGLCTVSHACEIMCNWCILEMYRLKHSILTSAIE